MRQRRAAALLALALLATGCNAAVQSSSTVDDPATGNPADSTDSTDSTDNEAAPDGQGTTSTTAPSRATTSTTTPATTTAPSSTTTSTTSTTSTTTTSTTSTTTTTLPPLDVYDIQCALQVFPGESLDDIAALFDDDTVDAETIMAENDLDSPELVPDQLLDVCVDNGINDIDGSARTERNSVVVLREVMAQQEKLNELFDGFGIRELTIDGISGPVTRQRLCAFRLSANLPATTEDMIAGSEEEALLMSTERLGIPFTSAILEDRWSLVDLTCQIMFVGVGTERLQFVFPTSSGLAEFPTRPQDRRTAFKFNPARSNNGWHDSFDFPASEDNPLNGNMYKPIYFDNGQAIHGANNVPRSPASHGCLRLRLDNMDALVNWLGLGDVSGVTYDEGRINLSVNVQGRYVNR